MNDLIPSLVEDGGKNGIKFVNKSERPVYCYSDLFIKSENEAKGNKILVFH